MAGDVLPAEPPISTALRPGGRYLVSAPVPAAPGTLRVLQGQSPTMPGKIYVVLSARGQSRELPPRPRSHHPAHSCFQPLGKQTLLEENIKDLISFTLFFQREVYTIIQDKPAGGNGEHFMSSLIYLYVFFLSRILQFCQIHKNTDTGMLCSWPHMQHCRFCETRNP